MLAHVADVTDRKGSEDVRDAEVYCDDPRQYSMLFQKDRDKIAYILDYKL